MGNQFNNDQPAPDSECRGLVLLHLALQSAHELLLSYQGSTWYTTFLFSSGNTASFREVHADLSRALRTFNYAKTGNLMEFAEAHAESAQADRVAMLDTLEKLQGDEAALTAMLAA